jgi:N-acetylmuramoyl-L-alanine amidase
MTGTTRTLLERNGERGMAGWRSSWKRAGLLGIAVAVALGLAACGTASGQTGTAAGVSTTEAVDPAGPTTVAPSTVGPTTTSGGTIAGPTTTAGGTAGPTTTVGSGQGAAATSGPRGTASARAKLRLGDHGKDVAALQRRLAALGYEVHKADGEFGPATNHALVAFQKVNRLDRDGVAGPETMKALAHPRLPRPRLGGRGLHIEADLTLQVVYVVENGKIHETLDASSASGRRYVSQGHVRIAHTPEGSFRIERKTKGWHHSALGPLYSPAYFDGPYAIHGAPRVPPFPDSHGCIRITPTAMDGLYGRLVLGTRMLVYRT